MVGALELNHAMMRILIMETGVVQTVCQLTMIGLVEVDLMLEKIFAWTDLWDSKLLLIKMTVYLKTYLIK